MNSYDFSKSDDSFRNTLYYNFFVNIIEIKWFIILKKIFMSSVVKSTMKLIESTS